MRPRHALGPHPDGSAGPVSSLEADAERRGGELVLRYVLEGRLGEIAIPAVGPPDRADDLWKHTCFEAFVRAPHDTAYWEFNLSPSTRWQAYAFSGYRERDADPQVAPPGIAVHRAGDRLELSAHLDLSRLKGPWQVALTAVIEAGDGAHGYWSLRHAPGRPDFHNPAGFVLDLPPP